jgi:NTE family protein
VAAARLFGLALSGGVLRCAAHVGVLKVLDREGLRPDCIAGSSAGAIVGALYAAGVAPEEIHRQAKSFRWISLARPTWKLWANLLDLEPLIRWLRGLGLGTFDDLGVRFAAVACDLATGRSVVLDSGDVAEAIRASTAVPALFPVVERDGRQLVDGGIVNDLPADVVRTLGADYVAGVDALPMGQIFYRSNHMLEVLFRSRYLSIRANHPPPEAFDCLIVPEIEECSLIDFSELDLLVRRGEEAAERAVDRLHRDLGR